MRRPSSKSRAAAAALPAGDVALREGVLATARKMGLSGLSPGRSGNVSARFGDGFLITPTGLAYETMTADQIVFVAGDGKVAPGSLRPSSEWQFHRSVYAARADAHAIVHTHSLHAVVLACTHRPIPAFHYMVAAAGGSDIPCVPYATFGTDDLARHVAAGLRHRDACLMANHGQIAIGTSLPRALALAEEVECLAEQYVKVSMLGPVHLLDSAEMARVVERFKSYGQNVEGTARPLELPAPKG